MRIVKFIRATPLLLVPLALSVSQTRTNFDAKYGTPSYEIRPGVWMAAKFSADGQVCEAQIKEQTNCRVGPQLPGTDGGGLKDLLNELAPEIKRGKFINRSEFAMDCCNGYTDEYENVTVFFNDRVLLGSKTYSVLTIRWKNRKCTVD